MLKCEPYYSDLLLDALNSIQQAVGGNTRLLEVRENQVSSNFLLFRDAPIQWLRERKQERMLRRNESKLKSG